MAVHLSGRLARQEGGEQLRGADVDLHETGQNRRRRAHHRRAHGHVRSHLADDCGRPALQCTCARAATESSWAGKAWRCQLFWYSPITRPNAGDLTTNAQEERTAARRVAYHLFCSQDGLMLVAHACRTLLAATAPGGRRVSSSLTQSRTAAQAATAAASGSADSCPGVHSAQASSRCPSSTSMEACSGSPPLSGARLPAGTACNSAVRCVQASHCLHPCDQGIGKVHIDIQFGAGTFSENVWPRERCT